MLINLHSMLASHAMDSRIYHPAYDMHIINLTSIAKMLRPALAALTSMAVAQLRDEDGGLLQSSGGKLRRGGSMLKNSRDIDDAGVVPAIRCGVAAAHLAQAIVGSAIMTMGAYLSWANALTYGIEVGFLS